MFIRVPKADQTNKGDRMNSEKDTGTPSTPKHDLVWIISEGKLSEIDLNEIDGPTPKNPVKAYHISDLANYLLNPNPVQVKKKLIGCETHRPRPLSVKIKDGFRKFFSSPTSIRSMNS